MVHVRLNEKESNPNPHVNFISALPHPNAESQEEARQYLRALAAQVRPIMKSHGFTVNSLEEYEHNTVFAGRNWNNGETIELVLRRYVLGQRHALHELGRRLSLHCNSILIEVKLAHIKVLLLSHPLNHVLRDGRRIQHMNHGPAFQALWKRLNTEVQALQVKGYYGDGYWSSGSRLCDSSRISGDGLSGGELPEYVCGGAQARSRPSAQRRSRPGSSQTTRAAKKRKAGSRVTSQNAFKGNGVALNQGDTSGKGTGFGKRANSKRARDERALAIQKRLQGLKKEEVLVESPPSPESSDDDNNSSDIEEGVIIVPETDAERRNTLETSQTNSEDLKNLKSTDIWRMHQEDFKFTVPPANRNDRRTSCDIIELTDDEGDEPRVTGKVSGSSGGATAASSPPKLQQAWLNLKTFSSSSSGENLKANNFVSRRMSNKITPRVAKKQDIRPVIDLTSDDNKLLSNLSGEEKKAGATTSTSTSTSSQWDCQICTLLNESHHLACSACGTPRGQKAWSVNL